MAECACIIEGAPPWNTRVADCPVHGPQENVLEGKIADIIHACDCDQELDDCDRIYAEAIVRELPRLLRETGWTP
jgi:hypothetical protein